MCVAASDCGVLNARGIATAHGGALVRQVRQQRARALRATAAIQGGACLGPLLRVDFRMKTRRSDFQKRAKPRVFV
jgi:hypothetical protein